MQNAAADFGFHCRQNPQSVKGTLDFKNDFVKHGWLSSPFSASIAQTGERRPVGQERIKKAPGRGGR